MVINEVARIAENGISAFENDDDLVLTEKALPANIKLFEVLLENQPENYRLLTLLARLYGSYGFAFFESRLEALELGISYPTEDAACCRELNIETTRETLDRYFLKGSEYALRALEVHHKNSRERMRKVTTVDLFFRSLAKEDVPALFWYGFNLGGYVNLNRNSVKAISKAHLAEKAMLRVVELDPGYFHAGGHLFLLAYYGSRTTMMGGNPETALMHYQKLKRLTGKDFLLGDLYYARYYLYPKQEREKFEKILSDIIKYRSSSKRYRLLNQVAANRASVYLQSVDYFFDE